MLHAQDIGSDLVRAVIRTKLDKSMTIYDDSNEECKI